jgi:hypothetical protein
MDLWRADPQSIFFQTIMRISHNTRPRLLRREAQTARKTESTPCWQSIKTLLGPSFSHEGRQCFAIYAAQDFKAFEAGGVTKASRGRPTSFAHRKAP